MFHIFLLISMEFNNMNYKSPHDACTETTLELVKNIYNLCLYIDRTIDIYKSKISETRS